MVENFQMDNPDNPAGGAAFPAPQANEATMPVDPPPPPTPGQLILRGVEAHFLSKRARAIANLNSYMVSPVGIGEHPDLVEECVKFLEEIDNADSVLATLNRVVST